MEIWCANCDKDIPLSKKNEFGGFEKCPHCGAVTNVSFDTSVGVHTEGIVPDEYYIEDDEN